MSLKATILILGLVWSFQAALGIRFVIDREECFSHKAEYEGDTLHVSFVVIKSDSQWHFNEDGVDLVVWLHFICTPVNRRKKCLRISIVEYELEAIYVVGR